MAALDAQALLTIAIEPLTDTLDLIARRFAEQRARRRQGGVLPVCLIRLAVR